MRIAHVVSTFSPQLGGMGKVCADEASALVKAGHQVTVFTLKYNQLDNTEHDKKLPFKIVRLRPLIKIGDAGLVPQLLWKIGNNFDLVHLHYPFYGGAEWLWFVKIPLIITYHMDAQVGGFKSVIAAIYNLIWPKFLFAKAKKIITVNSNFNHSKFLKYFSTDKVIEINNGIDTDIFKPQAAEFDALELSKLKGKKIILFVGNLLAVKRLDLLIRAVKLLGDAGVALVVVGAGYEERKYKQMARDLDITAQVHFVGPCDNQIKLAQYYNIASCVAVPSDYESFSLVAIEAMACGKPLIISGLPDVKQRFSQAIFFEKGSEVSLKNALVKAISVPEEEAKRIEEQSREVVIQNFSFDSHLKKLKNVYQQVVNR
jgi:glycosyltransferase involved in cell wall biosynthesis